MTVEAKKKQKLIFTHTMDNDQARVRTLAAEEVDGVSFNVIAKAGEKYTNNKGEALATNKLIGQTTAISNEALSAYSDIVQNEYYGTKYHGPKRTT